MPSDQNPYAAPLVAETVLPARPVRGSLGPWTATGLIREAWECVRADPLVIIGSIVLGYLLLIGVGQVTSRGIDAVLGPNPDLDARSGFQAAFWDYFLSMQPRILLSLVLGLPFTAAMEAGWAKVFLASARGEKPGIGMLFSGLPNIIPFLIKNVLLYLAYGAGFVLLIVPALIAMVGFGVTSYFIVDKGLGPVDALRASWRATRGYKWDLFGLLLLCGLLNMAGFAACCVGVVITMPVITMTRALLYLHLTDSADEGGEGRAF